MKNKSFVYCEVWEDKLKATVASADLLDELKKIKINTEELLDNSLSEKYFAREIERMKTRLEKRLFEYECSGKHLGDTIHLLGFKPSLSGTSMIKGNCFRDNYTFDFGINEKNAFVNKVYERLREHPLYITDRIL